VGYETALVLARPAGEVAVTLRRPERDREVVALFDEHYRGLCRLATLLLGDEAAAEEVVQEAFLRTYAGWWRLRRPTRARWYLRAAVVNQCRSRGRRRAAEDRGNRTVWATEGADAPAWDTDRAGESLVVVEAVRALPRRQREAVVLRYYEDLSDADVAAVLGCSVGTVKSQLSKARATLARRLAEPADPGGPGGPGDPGDPGGPGDPGDAGDAGGPGGPGTEGAL
jgi:RNA polymerase sigma-70 factor (sigma-E family)